MSNTNLQQEFYEAAEDVRALFEQAQITQAKMAVFFTKMQEIIETSAGQFSSFRRDTDRLGRAVFCLALSIKNLESASGLLEMATRFVSSERKE